MADPAVLRSVVEEGLEEAREILHPECRRGRVLLNSPLRRFVGVSSLAATDSLALLAGLALAGYFVDGGARVGELLFLAPLLLAVWLAIFAAYGLYGRGQARRNFKSLLGAVMCGVALLAVGALIYPQGGFSTKELALGSIFLVGLSVGAQLLYWASVGYFHRRGYGRLPTLVVGEEGERAHILRAMKARPGAYACVGELDMNGDGGSLGLVRLRQMLDLTGARSVILTRPERLPDTQFLNLLRSMWLRKVKVRVVPGAPALMNSSLVISQDVGVPLLEVGYPQLSAAQWTLKRTLDVVVSLGLLLMLSPLLLGVAALIRLTSPGPALFRQKRAGTDETTFVCYKFRSMYRDAQRRQAELEAINEADGAVFKIKYDPRVTPVGRFIRRWSIDELPQLINILKGEMSLVGPRPLPLRDFELMIESHKRRLATVPGLTGYWQISGRSDLSFEEMVRLDLYYIENWSLFLDLEILLKTFKVVLRHEGAY